MSACSMLNSSLLHGLKSKVPYCRRQILLYYLQNNRPIVLLTWQITKWIHQATSGHQPSLILPTPPRRRRRGKHPAHSIRRRMRTSTGRGPRPRAEGPISWRERSPWQPRALEPSLLRQMVVVPLVCENWDAAIDDLASSTPPRPIRTCICAT